MHGAMASKGYTACRAPLRPLEHGVTLVELAVVVVIVGILAAVATPRFFDDRTFLERGYYEELTAALRYARKLAVASGCPVQLAIDAAGYAASQQGGGRCDREDSAPGNAARSWSGPVLAGRSPIGVSVAPAVTLTFDALGRTDLAADQPINVGSFALLIRAETGHVQAP